MDEHIGRGGGERELPQVTRIGAVVSIIDNMRELERTEKLAGRGA